MYRANNCRLLDKVADAHKAVAVYSVSSAQHVIGQHAAWKVVVPSFAVSEVCSGRWTWPQAGLVNCLATIQRVQHSKFKASFGYVVIYSSGFEPQQSWTFIHLLLLSHDWLSDTPWKTVIEHLDYQHGKRERKRKENAQALFQEKLGLYLDLQKAYC